MQQTIATALDHPKETFFIFQVLGVSHKTRRQSPSAMCQEQYQAASMDPLSCILLYARQYNRMLDCFHRINRGFCRLDWIRGYYSG